MLSIIYGCLACICLSSVWGASVLGSCLVSFVSLFLLNQSFSAWSNNFFSGGSLSVLLVFLSSVLCFLSLLSTPAEKSSKYVFWICCLMSVLVLTFSVGNLIYFYVLFEASLIPTLMLIIGWGYQPERLQAGSYMMLYTVAASLPLLVLIVHRCYTSSSAQVLVLENCSFSMLSVLVLVGYAAFLVKLPMYSVHLWLPKAHVEAPLAGSMILAGILLKLGGFGLFQMNKVFAFGAASVFIFFLSALSLWGGLLSSLMCLRQVDMKALVAYSSVGHMGIVAVGFMLDRSWGVASATITMFAHGFSSSALFCLAYFTYEKSHTRSLLYMGGFLVAYPTLAFFWFLYCCINMAAPPTLNLVGELMVVPSLWSAHLLLVIVMGLMVFVSAAYNMFLYCSVNHGTFSSFMKPGRPHRSFEMLSLVLHMAPLLLLMKSEIFI